MTGKIVLFSASLFLCCWPWSVCTQQGIGLTLNNVTYTNNSVVTITDIGTGSAALICTTTYTPCCYSVPPPGTHWYFPNGSQVESNNILPHYRTRTYVGGAVLLYRNPRATTTGVFRCEILDANGTFQSIYVGIYTAYSGSPNVTSLGYDNQSRTFTCTFERGPATTVTWRKNGAVITLNATYQQTTRVVDLVTGTYQTVLTIGPSVSQSDIVGTYECTVENNWRTTSVTRVVAGNGVSFWFRGTTYQNNSLVTLEDIGEGGDAALLCVTDQPACCRPPHTGVNVSTIGNWYFPNGTRVHSSGGDQWDFYRTRGQSVVSLHRRKGGVTGIYRCVVPDAMKITQTIYIGVYTADAASPPTAPPSTVVCPRVESGSLVGAVVGACISTALLYTVILLVWVLWNKRHRKTRKADTEDKHLDTDIAMKKCAAYEGVTAHSGMEDVYEHPR